MLGELGLRVLARAAELTVHGSFHNYPGCVFVRGHRNLEVHIAVCAVNAGFLQERGGHVENLKFPPGSRCFGEDDVILRPTENGIHPDFLCGNHGYRDVFSGMPEIKNVRLKWQAFAEIFGIRLQHAIVGTIAGDAKQSEDCQAAKAENLVQGSKPDLPGDLNSLFRRHEGCASWPCSPVSNFDMKPNSRSLFIKPASR